MYTPCFGRNGLVADLLAKIIHIHSSLQDIQKYCAIYPADLEPEPSSEIGTGRRESPGCALLCSAEKQGIFSGPVPSLKW